MWTGGLCAHMEIEGPLGHIVPSCGLVVYVPTWRSKGNHCRTYRAIMWTGGLCALMEIEGPWVRFLVGAWTCSPSTRPEVVWSGY
ncbi:hypothetical protein ACOMHN_001686 [Nucella lapillus]